MGLAPFPVEERVSLRKNELGIAAEKCASTENTNTKVVKLGAKNTGYVGKHVSYADAVKYNNPKG